MRMLEHGTGLMKYWVFGFLLICSSSCVNSKFTGNHTSTIASPQNKQVIFVDYTDIGDLDVEEPWLSYYNGHDFEYDFLLCANNSIDNISENCLVQSADSLSADIIIYAYTESFREGDKINYTSDYQNTRTLNRANASRAESSHRAVVHFDVYSKKLNTKLSSFNVITTSSGLAVKNRKNEGVTQVNGISPAVSTRTARKKGLKNIINRLKFIDRQR